MLNLFFRTELLGKDAMERLAASRVADIYKTRVDPPPHGSLPGTCGGVVRFGMDAFTHTLACARQMLFSSLTAAAAGCWVDSTMQTFRSGTVSVRSIRNMECPQSSSDGKDAGTKPIPKFAFTMGSI